MAGRGRGRGRGLSINIEALGLGRAELIPHVVAQPPPLYPPLSSKPVDITVNDETEYILALKEELRLSFLKSAFYINEPDQIKDIERYSDKYQPGANESTNKMESINWTRIPEELHEKKRKRTITKVKPNLKKARTIKTEDVSALFNKLEDTAVEETEEAGENEGEPADKKDKEEGEDNEENEEEYDEEDLEEETDYNLSYFDNGEGYGDDDEDDDEGPTY